LARNAFLKCPLKNAKNKSYKACLLRLCPRISTMLFKRFIFIVYPYTPLFRPLSHSATPICIWTYAFREKCAKKQRRNFICMRIDVGSGVCRSARVSCAMRCVTYGTNPSSKRNLANSKRNARRKTKETSCWLTRG